MSSNYTVHFDVNSTDGHRIPPLFEIPYKDTISFGPFAPHYHQPMHFPNEVELYEPDIAGTKASAAATATAVTSAADRSWTRNTTVVKREVEVHLPCGFFNIWRPLYDCNAPISARLRRYLPEGQASAKESARGSWDSRISYSSADDEYYINGVPLPFIKHWSHGLLSGLNVFRKVEHDWLMTYLAPTENRRPEMQSVMVWRFNYVESKRVIDKFHAMLGISVFSETAAAQWYIRPLSQLKYTKIPIHLLTADEAAFFTEIPDIGDNSKDSSTGHREARERIIKKYHGHILTYRANGDEFNDYIVHSIPGLAADLSQYVEGEYGFDIGVSFLPASSGESRWQKVQIARQSLREPVNGHTKEADAAIARCGLDFRIKLGESIKIDPVPDELLEALSVGNPEDDSKACEPKMDDSTCGFTICVKDPENTVGSLQPPIRAHESVLSAGSEYFAALLASSMTETAAKQVVLDGLSYGAVRLAINFLYIGSIPNEDTLDIDDWVTLLGVASRLSITRLQQMCQVRIYQHALMRVHQCTSDQKNNNQSEHYKTKAEFPDSEFIEHLHDIATDTGAQELGEALKQLVEYYPIQICEHRIRDGGPYVEFTAMYNPLFAHEHHNHHGDRNRFWHPVQWHGDGANLHGMGMPGLMAGPVVHPELAGELLNNHNTDGSEEDGFSDTEFGMYHHDEADVGFHDIEDFGNNDWADEDNTDELDVVHPMFAQFLGNWRVVGDQHQDGSHETQSNGATSEHSTTPPQPQPGLAPADQQPRRTDSN
ncbi:hypothetical protein GGI25_003792 [Coemansia spiralis]|uniref:BTB domain-containing protein n=2 Tax=Coemansia TaxID=4863 RepID=A0A9W8KW70_9FUNG|nr:hypothetical protein BX070DRAFT_72769 [Coemansia spiralis]KAJ1994393.1 hypothetical protein EDC05_001592 [Coemansia umbellata]KAJ2624298.1 hypothetical protein GGI26_001654 [Coemansia sp. RSA 1358]KAJ2675955.1 hypothetical protein GGI25_003792 [Coemansia spiralis]